MRRWIAMMVAVLAAATVGLVTPAAATVEPYCGSAEGRCQRRTTSGAPPHSSTSGPAGISASTASCWTFAGKRPATGSST
jgi:hypothetical protein